MVLIKYVLCKYYCIFKYFIYLIRDLKELMIIINYFLVLSKCMNDVDINLMLKNNCIYIFFGNLIFKISSLI